MRSGFVYGHYFSEEADMYTRDLEVDFVIQAERFRELERQHQRNLWMLIISSGGEIRVPRSVQRDVNDPGDIVVTQDEKTGEMVFTATLYTPGVSKSGV